jgi:hypothetical protein
MALNSPIITARQEPAYAIAQCGISNIGAGNGLTIPLPVNALLLDIVADTTTAFNAGTTATLTASDGTTTFINAVSVAATAHAQGANIGKFYPSGGTLSITLAETGTAATTGNTFVSAKYVVIGREQYSFGTNVVGD